MNFILLDDAVLRFEGKDCINFLQKTLSNDLKLLNKTQGLPSFFLNAKGKWIASLYLFQIDDFIFAKTSRKEAENLLQAIQPLILFSDSQVKDLSQDFQWILGVGPDISAWAEKKHSLPTFPYNELRLPACLMLCPRKDAQAWLVNQTKAPLQPEAFEELRIESGLPIYGVDVDEKTIPLEAGMDDYFSYTKGCYVGQETISRIKHYGKVNKKLVKLKIPPEAPFYKRGERGNFGVLPIFLNEKEVGKLSSLCYSPFYSAPIGLAILNQEATTPGTVVTLKTPEGDISAQVIE